VGCAETLLLEDEVLRPSFFLIELEDEKMFPGEDTFED
jgi:hypothetical protein